MRMTEQAIKSVREEATLQESEKRKIRKEDIMAIKRTIALVRGQCQEHERCKECKLYSSGIGCVMDRPPAYLNEDEIIEALQ